MEHREAAKFAKQSKVDDKKRVRVREVLKFRNNVEGRNVERFEFPWNLCSELEFYVFKISDLSIFEMSRVSELTRRRMNRNWARCAIVRSLSHRVWRLFAGIEETSARETFWRFKCRNEDCKSRQCDVRERKRKRESNTFELSSEQNWKKSWDFLWMKYARPKCPANGKRKVLSLRKTGVYSRDTFILKKANNNRQY